MGDVILRYLNIHFFIATLNSLWRLLCAMVFFAWFLSGNTIAQTPGYIKNYPPNVYHASPAVFNIAKDREGLLYFGTNKGVVVYDGARWQMVSISNYSDVKTLEPGPDGKIYVGANGNFGYLEHDLRDGFKYISISDSLPPSQTNFNDVWQIVFIKDRVYFDTYTGYFMWDKKSLTYFKTTDIFIYNINDQLYGSAFPTGKFGPMNGSVLEPIPDFPNLEGDFVYQIFDMPSAGQYLMATSEYGLYLYNINTGKISKFDSEANNYISKNSFYDGMKISNTLFALGTWEGGLIFINGEGKLLGKIDQSSGLNANHVYDLKTGNENDLWLATSNGISRIDLDSLPFYSQQASPAKFSPFITKVDLSFSDHTYTLTPFKNGAMLVHSLYHLKDYILNISKIPGSLTLYFATPGYGGEDVSYTVYLDGNDQRWSDWKADPIKEYTQLNPGNYTFYVQAKNQQNGTLSNVTAFNVNIKALWYQTWWFKAGLIAFALGAAFLVVKLFINRLKAQNTILEAMVSARTKDLKQQQKKLETVNDNLLVANKELDSFVYHTSHDLKSPLKSVLGLIDLAKRDDEQGSFRPYHDRMESSIKKLEEFISSIVQYSANSKTSVDYREVSFEDLIDQAIDDLRYHASFDSINIEKHIESDGAFYTDKKRLQIIINNLLSNAIKYHDPGKPQPIIKIAVKQQNSMAHIRVWDNGLGINPDYHEKVFSMFYRASESSYGSGLGLYIIKETVGKLGGTIHLRSEEGIFTEFDLQLPNKKSAHHS